MGLPARSLQPDKLLQATLDVEALALVAVELEPLDSPQLTGLAGGLRIPSWTARMPRGELQVCRPRSARPCVGPMRRGQRRSRHISGDHSATGPAR